MTNPTPEKLIDQTLESIEKEELGEKQADLQAGQPRKTKFASIPSSTGKFLYNLVIHCQARTILEIGSSVGYSTLWLAKAAIKNSGRIWATEINTGRIELAKKHFKQSDTESLITLLPIDAAIVLEKWKDDQKDQKIDFVFIDAFKKDYQKYYELVLPLMAPGGIIAFDNIISHQETVKDFLEKVSTDDRVTSRLEKIDNGILIITKNSS